MEKSGKEQIFENKLYKHFLFKFPIVSGKIKGDNGKFPRSEVENKGWSVK